MAYLKPIQKKKIKSEYRRKGLSIGLIIGIIGALIIVFFMYRLTVEASKEATNETPQLAKYNSSDFQSIKKICDEDICRYYGEIE